MEENRTYETEEIEATKNVEIDTDLLIGISAMLGAAVGITAGVVGCIAFQNIGKGISMLFRCCRGS